MTQSLLQSAPRRQRGFTLIELMVVVVIIAVLATLSVPLFVTKMRERRAQQTALQLAGLYREARMRALGRGAAVLVSHDSGNWEVQEGVEGVAASTARTGNANCQALPTRGCLTNPWNGTASRDVGDFKPSAVSSDISAKFSDGKSRNLCFTPLGRTFVQVAGGAWEPLTSVISIDVKRGDDGLNRRVIVMPNGTARLGL